MNVKVNSYSMILCYLVELFGSIILTSIYWIIYYTPDDIKCFLSHPFAPVLIYVLTLIIIITILLVYLCISNIKWKREQHDFELRRSTWR